MSLGTSGPPATAKQIAYLKVLLEKAGYATWREARRPLGLTQRQGSGKFTKREASELIERLLGTGPTDEESTGPEAGASTTFLADTRHQTEDTIEDVLTDNAQHDLARGLPAAVLAEELLRRGWSVTPPSN